MRKYTIIIMHVYIYIYIIRYYHILTNTSKYQHCKQLLTNINKHQYILVYTYIYIYKYHCIYIYISYPNRVGSYTMNKTARYYSSNRTATLESQRKQRAAQQSPSCRDLLGFSITADSLQLKP